jgi:integrase
MMTMQDYVARYELKRGIRSNSAAQYRIAARCIEAWAKRPVQVEEMSADLFNAWLVAIERRLSNETVRTRKRHVAALWRAAHADGLCPNAYCSHQVRRVTCRRPPTRAWSVDEVRRIVEAAKKLQGTQDVGLSKATFWELAVRTAWDTALRMGDLLEARTGDFSPEGEAVLTQSKTGRPVFVRMNPKTRELQQQATWRLRRKLIPWPYSREHFRKEFERLVHAAGLVGSMKKLRKSSATNVEIRTPGWGAIHLGHLTGFKTADQHYFDFGLIGSKKPDPEEL